MELVRIAAPGEPVLTLQEAREHCRADAWGSPPVHPDDALLEAYVQAATDELDGADGWLGRALVMQTWRMTLPRFPDVIQLPLTSPQPGGSPPPDVVQSITYVDSDGVLQTLDAADYTVISEADPIRVERLFNTVWPATRRVRDAVRVTYHAGYGAAAEVPELVKGYIRARVGQFYAHREAVVAGTIMTPTPFVRDSLEALRKRGVIRS